MKHLRVGRGVPPSRGRRWNAVYRRIAEDMHRRGDASEGTLPKVTRRARKRVRSPHQTKRQRGRRGSGLKGSRTERMVEQLVDFKAWLRDNPVNERNAARTVGARASTYWRLHEKTFAKDATRTGEKRGFSSSKTLASAYRNGKR